MRWDEKDECKLFCDVSTFSEIIIEPYCSSDIVIYYTPLTFYSYIIMKTFHYWSSDEIRSKSELKLLLTYYSLQMLYVAVYSSRM